MRQLASMYWSIFARFEYHELTCFDSRKCYGMPANITCPWCAITFGIYELFVLLFPFVLIVFVEIEEWYISMSVS